jgi:hypothetical protein
MNCEITTRSRSIFVPTILFFFSTLLSCEAPAVPIPIPIQGGETSVLVQDVMSKAIAEQLFRVAVGMENSLRRHRRSWPVGAEPRKNSPFTRELPGIDLIRYSIPLANQASIGTWPDGKSCATGRETWNSDERKIVKAAYLRALEKAGLGLLGEHVFSTYRVQHRLEENFNAEYGENCQSKVCTVDFSESFGPVCGEVPLPSPLYEVGLSCVDGSPLNMTNENYADAYLQSEVNIWKLRLHSTGEAFEYKPVQDRLEFDWEARVWYKQRCKSKNCSYNVSKGIYICIPH